MEPQQIVSAPAQRRQTVLWAALGVSLLVNAIVIGGVIALLISSSAAASIAPRLGLATAHKAEVAQLTADDAAAAASDVESRVSDLEWHQEAVIFNRVLTTWSRVCLTWRVTGFQ